MAWGVTSSDVSAAARRIEDFVVETPALHAPALSAMVRAEVYLKLETRQRTGSFKDRGAANFLSQLSGEARERGVIAMSAGNHAQAVAYQSKRLGIPATIVMPEGTPFTKVRRTEAFGAQIVLAGEGLHDAEVHARRIASERGLTLVHPYDAPAIISGQGTVALELLRAVSDLDTIVVPIGGGGLASGVALAAKELRSSVEIVGVQAARYPSMERVLRGLEPEPGGQTIAEGIAVKSVGVLTRVIVAEFVKEVLLVEEDAIERAIHLLLEEEKLLAEGAGASSLAALLAYPERFAGRRIGLVVTGGNIDTGLLATVIDRVRRSERRVVRLRVEIADRPGVLAHVASVVGATGANILEVEHQRMLADVSSKNAGLDLTVEIRSPSDIGNILARLSEARYRATVLDASEPHA